MLSIFCIVKDCYTKRKKPTYTNQYVSCCIYPVEIVKEIILDLEKYYKKDEYIGLGNNGRKVYCSPFIDSNKYMLVILEPHFVVCYHVFVRNYNSDNEAIESNSKSSLYNKDRNLFKLLREEIQGELVCKKVRFTS